MIESHFIRIARAELAMAILEKLAQIGKANNEFRTEELIIELEEMLEAESWPLNIEGSA